MTYDKNKEETKRMKARYFLNRNGLIKKLRKYRETLEKVALEGVKEEDDMRIARIACSILASDLYYEDAVNDDKTGETNPRDEMDEFLNNLEKSKNSKDNHKKNIDDLLGNVGKN